MGKISQPGSVIVIYWVLEQIKPGTSLKAKLTQLKLSYCEHIKRRQCSLEKTVKVGRAQEAGKEETNTRWIGSIREAVGMSLQALSRAVEDKTLWTSLVRRVTRSWSRFSDMQHTRSWNVPSVERRASPGRNAAEGSSGLWGWTGHYFGATVPLSDTGNVSVFAILFSTYALA